MTRRIQKNARPIPGRAFDPWCHPDWAAYNKKRADVGASTWQASPTRSQVQNRLLVSSFQSDTLSPDNGGISGPDYCPSDGGSAGDSQVHSAPALVSGSQLKARLSAPRYDAYSS